MHRRLSYFVILVARVRVARLKLKAADRAADGRPIGRPMGGRWAADGRPVDWVESASSDHRRLVFCDFSDTCGWPAIARPMGGSVSIRHRVGCVGECVADASVRWCNFHLSEKGVCDVYVNFQFYSQIKVESPQAAHF